VKKNRHVTNPAHRLDSKARIITAGLLLCALNVFPQPPAQQLQEYTYCAIIGTMKALSQEPTVKLDCEGKKKEYRSLSDAMTEKSAEGWEFVQAYSSSGGVAIIQYWIIRKKK